jgi:hypothetical protein
MSWQQACADFAERHAVQPRWVQVLRAFGEWDLGEAPAFSSLEGPIEPACEAVVQALSSEVDPAQAAMFARRLAAVDALLARNARPEARLLRVGLARRIPEILAAPAPHALRVRACVDFYFSQAAVLEHEDPLAPSIEELASTLVWQPVARGLEHALLEGVTRWGPLHVNLLRIGAPRGLRCLDLRGRSGTFSDQVAGEGALAGVSGGFFLYSEPDIRPPSVRGDPVGLLVSDGRVQSPPVLGRTALRSEGSRWWLERVTLEGWVLGGQRIAAVNRADLLGQGVVAFNRAFGDRVSWSGPRRALVGQRLLETPTSEIPLNGALVCWPHGSSPPEPGALELRLTGQGMAGGPVLLRDGALCLDLVAEDFAGSAPPITFSKDETYDQNLLPRMAAGLHADGGLVFAAVDGRNLDRAPGLTLGQTARLLRALGCREAMNLDGGSSKRMVVSGRVVDLPSTEVLAGGPGGRKIRPVRSAILVI